MTTFESSPQIRSLAAAVCARVPAFLWGNPGITKTATVEGHVKAWGRHIEVLIGSTLEPSDFSGPMVETPDGVVGYKPLRWVRDANAAKGGAVIFGDEYNHSQQAVMAAMQRMLQEKWVGDTKLGDDVSIILAGNYPEVAPEANELTPAVANRLLHLDWSFDAQTWKDNVGTNFEFVEYPALDKLVHPDPATKRVIIAARITAFLDVFPDLLAPEPPKDISDLSGAWCSPRSWTNVINTLAWVRDGDKSTEMMIIKGLVGEAALKSFIEWEVTADLKNPLDVLADPSIVDWAGERPDRLFHTASAVAGLGLSDEKHWLPALKALTTCAQSGKADVAEHGVMRLLNNMPAKARVPDSTRRAFAALLEKMDNGVTGLAA